MFRQQLNQVRIDLSITPQGPVLIRSGRTGADPTRPDLEFVRTTVDGAPSVYLGGSSIKGVLRSHCERMLLSEGVQITDTFSPKGRGAFRQDAPGPEAYAGTCPVGRTFGNLHLKGRTSISDHIPGGHEPAGSEARRRELEAANAVETRNGVGIDRILGSASTGALYDREVVVAGRFDGQIVLRNVQLYQITLLLLALRDLDEGYLQIGSGTSRGQGRVGAEIRQLVIESRRGRTPEGKLAGYAALLTDAAEQKAYDLFPGDLLDLPEELPGPRPQLLWDRLVVDSRAGVDALAEALVSGPWSAFLDRAQKRKGWAA